MTQSEFLQTKVVQAHDELWRKINGLRTDLPSPYGTVVGLWFSVLTPQELLAFKEKPENQFSLQDAKFLRVVKEYNIDLIRPYVDEQLWRMAGARIRFTIRLLQLFSTDTSDQNALVQWPEDEIVVQNLLEAFSKEELERFSYSTPGTFQQIMRLWDSRIIDKIRNGLFKCS